MISSLSSKPTMLVQLSGGIDSAFVLWDWLKNNPNEICLVHHINRKNHEGRLELEKIAVNNILNWLSANGLDNFIYVESGFDYGSLNYIIKDVEICGFFLGVILRNPKWASIEKILMPIYGDINSAREVRKRKILDIVSYDKKVRIEYPLKYLSKADVINKIPKKLLELTWYCRKPKNKLPCGDCYTCNEVRDGLEIIGKYKY